LAPDRDLYRVALGVALANQATTQRSAPRRASLLSEAVESLRLAVQRNRADPYTHFHLAEALELRFHSEGLASDLAEAAAAYEQAAALSPQRAIFLDASAQAHLLLGQPDEALARYLRAAQLLGPGAERTTRIGDCLAALGRLDEAREAYLTALEETPRLASARAGFARLLAREGRVEAALEQARLAARYQFREWRYRELLAELEHAASHPEAAIREGRAAARYAPPWEVARLRAQVDDYRRSGTSLVAP
jgi:tetratricopeptide (TPR) repeat protein